MRDFIDWLFGAITLILLTIGSITVIIGVMMLDNPVMAIGVLVMIAGVISLFIISFVD